MNRIADPRSCPRSVGTAARHRLDWLPAIVGMRTVAKCSGEREPFDRDKLLRSMRIALRKRPIDADRIDRVANALVRQFETSGEHDIPSSRIGEMVMTQLAVLDQVAFVRYASVYRDFRDASDFNYLIESMQVEAGISDP